MITKVKSRQWKITFDKATNIYHCYTAIGTSSTLFNNFSTSLSLEKVMISLLDFLESNCEDPLPIEAPALTFQALTVVKGETWRIARQVFYCLNLKEYFYVQIRPNKKMKWTDDRGFNTLTTIVAFNNIEAAMLKVIEIQGKSKEIN